MRVVKGKYRKRTCNRCYKKRERANLSGDHQNKRLLGEEDPHTLRRGGVTYRICEECWREFTATRPIEPRTYGVSSTYRMGESDAA